MEAAVITLYLAVLSILGLLIGMGLSRLERALLSWR